MARSLFSRAKLLPVDNVRRKRLISLSFLMKAVLP